ncbi:hypothetical protein [Nocardioides sp. B-3]|uniref:hypothetical protein n=1 Tax=Nocardioides sp. B-3 TaxID=2895565 RepID=UPI00215395EB|nr:hypothetical protein [Nocardioides sp. B-3]UUZ61109.1 hypothetical protein LP418_10995 [Nocardioides sp. B-3]
MSFSMAEFRAAIDKINRGMDDISAKMQEMPAAANSAVDHWYIPGFIADAIIWLCEKMIALAQKIWDKIVEVLKGIAAPVYFFMYSRDLNGVSTSARGVVANPADGQLVNASDWKGEAAEAYKREVPAQRDATGEVGAIADKMSSSLIWAAVAGCLFYVGLGVIIVKFVLAMIAAVAAFGSAVFSRAGAAIIVEEAGVNPAAIGALVATLLALLGDQVKEMVALQQAASSDKFPHGKWPKASA